MAQFRFSVLVLIFGYAAIASGAEQCYDLLGCFTDTGDYSNFNLPESPDVLNTRHLLFTSAIQTVDTADVLLYNDTFSIEVSKFNPKYPLYILAHGFTENYRKPWQSEFKDLVFAKHINVNVIIVDWARGALAPFYWNAAPNTQVVGAQTARVISHLMELKGARPANIHMTGISLGAHVSGYTGKRLQQFKNGAKLGRITGLDPAGPYFESAPSTARLDKNDAEFVDIMHGNMLPLYSGGFGISKQIGHIDFYPNGAIFQPGCPEDAIGATINQILSGNFDDLPGTIACSHVRPAQLILETARRSDCTFVSIPCENYEKFRSGGCTTPRYLNQAAKMGLFHLNAPSPMKQYLLTHANITEGLCGGSHLKVTIRASANEDARDAKGHFSVRLHSNGEMDVASVVAEQEKLIPGRELVELVISRLDFESVTHIELLYERACHNNMCWSDKVRIESVTLEELSLRERPSLKACFHADVLNSGVWSKSEATLSNDDC